MPVSRGQEKESNMEEQKQPVEKKKCCCCTALVGVLVIVFAWWHVSWSSIVLTALGAVILAKELLPCGCCCKKKVC